MVRSCRLRLRFSPCHRRPWLALILANDHGHSTWNREVRRTSPNDSGRELEGECVDFGKTDEDLDHLGVELAAGVAGYLMDSEVHGQGRLVSPLGGHGIESIGDEAG